MRLKAELNLAEQVAKYVKVCRKRSVLETKPIGKINVTELGICLPNGTIHFPHLNMTRYKTAEEAEIQAKKIVMKQFEAPVGQQKERMTAVVGSDLYIGEEGYQSMFGYACDTPFGARGKRAKLFHNHPTCTETMGSCPASLDDIGEMFNRGAQSITAFNAQGEFSTVKLIDKNKILKSFTKEQRERLKQHPENKDYLGSVFLRLVLLNDLSKEINKLETALGRKLTTEEFALAQHLSNKKILPEIGIEYKTNFSNLLKYDV